MTMLVLSLVALGVGPALALAAERGRRLRQALDGFVVVTVGGLVFLHILPEAIGHGGLLAGLLALLGVALPNLSDRLFERRGAQWHVGVVVLAVLGLGVHAAFDGVALAVSAHELHAEKVGHQLALGVIFHRLPVGLLLWWVFAPHGGPRVATASLAFIGAATVAGFAVGQPLSTAVAQEGVSYLMAFVAGALLHVVIHEVAPPASASACASSCGDGCAEEAEEAESSARAPQASALGAVAGVATLWLTLGADSHAHDAAGGAMHTFRELALESAPALLIAYVGAGLLRAFLSPASVGWLSRGGSFARATRGMAFGLPLPICSCGVVPFYESLMRAGAPVPAGVAFLIATPELGLDAVLLSLPLLGPTMTLWRVGAAAAVAIIVALVAGAFFKANAAASPQTDTPEQIALPLRERVASGLKFGLGEVVDSTLPWILVGLTAAAFVEPLLDGRDLAALPGFLDVPLAALAGAPLYVCASGATPFVAVLLYEGLSPGAALAFLLTGPATNLTTFGVLARLHGRSAAVVFAATVTAAAVSIGWLANFTLEGLETGAAVGQAGEHEHSVLQILCLGALGLLLIASLLRQGPRGMIDEVLSSFRAR